VKLACKKKKQTETNTHSHPCRTPNRITAAVIRTRPSSLRSFLHFFLASFLPSMHSQNYPGLHTRFLAGGSGYALPTTVKTAGSRKQTCSAPVTCPRSIENFTYGVYTGANETGAGYSPAFEPFWCGRWSGEW
jgi:hypothetical protein